MKNSEEVLLRVYAKLLITRSADSAQNKLFGGRAWPVPAGELAAFSQILCSWINGGAPGKGRERWNGEGKRGKR